ncbi:hypothetical protein [Aliivibrio finisterrensis]|nr:hypothetical protein [Aliivibrio finisterrensis]
MHFPIWLHKALKSQLTVTEETKQSVIQASGLSELSNELKQEIDRFKL